MGGKCIPPKLALVNTDVGVQRSNFEGKSLKTDWTLSDTLIDSA